MDYSAISSDTDHPPGTSPWGSPITDQIVSAAPPNGDIPPSSLAFQHQFPPDAGHHGKNPDVLSRTHGTPRGDSGYGAEQPPHGARSPQQSRSQLPARYQTAVRQHAGQSAEVYKIQAKITSLERTGKKDPVFRFDIHTNVPKFRTTQYRDVRRTHSEFIKLAEHLVSANPEAIVPAVPPPVTPAGAGTEEDEARVKASMQKWLGCVLTNDMLMQDDEVILFVESDFGYSPVVRMKQPATGVRRKVLKQFAPPPDDIPELQNARPTVKMFYLGAMDGSNKVDRMVKARRGLGLAETDFGGKLGQMHVQETHSGLANAYRKLGKVIQTVGDYHAAQATAEATTLGEPLNYHSSDAFIVKETLTNRHILLRDLLQAQQSTRGKRAAADRLKASSSVRSDKVDEAIVALEEAQKHEDYLEKKTRHVSSNLLLEKQRWFERTSNDMLTALREYTLRQIEAERRTLAMLESARPDIRGVDASGGLSRLGREGRPTARRSNVGSSQGPKGDAWSGIPRRSDTIGRSFSGSFMFPALADDEGVSGSGSPEQTRPSSGAGSIKPVTEEDEGRLDARNAASQLATSTF